MCVQEKKFKKLMGYFVSELEHVSMVVALNNKARQNLRNRNFIMKSTYLLRTQDDE